MLASCFWYYAGNRVRFLAFLMLAEKWGSGTIRISDVALHDSVRVIFKPRESFGVEIVNRLLRKLSPIDMKIKWQVMLKNKVSDVVYLFLIFMKLGRFFWFCWKVYCRGSIRFSSFENLQIVGGIEIKTWEYQYCDFRTSRIWKPIQELELRLEIISIVVFKVRACDLCGVVGSAWHLQTVDLTPPMTISKITL